MRESSLPLGGHSWESRFRANERVTTREKVALHMEIQAGGRMGRITPNTPAASREDAQIGMKLSISGDVLLNSRSVESPNPVSTSAKEGTRYARIYREMGGMNN